VKPRALVVLAFCGLAVALAAQGTHQVLFTPGAPVTVSAGASAKVELKFRILPGYHINSEKPAGELLIPTTLTLNAADGLSVASVAYPKPKELVFEFAPEEKLNVYDGDITVAATLKAAPSAAPGTRTLKGELRYQACNDRACFPPRKLPVEVEVRVVKTSAAKR
jgi:DsbC/DsbD-like thiol-disulfide interchange protein